MYNKNICISDNDCKDGQLCAFDDNDLKHYCVDNTTNALYHGCLNEDSINKLDNSIESKSKSDKLKINNCIDFGRRQKNQANFAYNFMIFKPQKPVFVDTTNINIYLKCADEILAVIPHTDYFKLLCDNNQENCTLEGKNGLMNFIIQNTKNCSKNIYLEVSYECENEKLRTIKKVNVDIKDKNQIIKINLTCPVNNENKNSKCISSYIEDVALEYDIVNKLIDKEKSINECENPLFRIPRIVSDVDLYKKQKHTQSKNEVKKVDDEINNKINDIKKMKAKKYAMLKKIHTGEIISLDDAYAIIDKISIEKMIKKNGEYWKTFKNYDAAQFLYNDEKNKDALIYFGKVYSLKEATRAATENNQSFFVWYHNSYDLDNFSSKLYFIDIFKVSNELFDKSNWDKHDNVTTGILNFENFEGGHNYGNVHSNGHSNEHSNENSNEYENYNEHENEEVERQKAIVKLVETAGVNMSLMNDKYKNYMENNMGNYDVNESVIKNLDNQITTYSQAINMNSYETKINDNIIKGCIITLFFVFVIFIIVLAYFNNISAGKIKIFGFNKQ